ncbi:MAG: hypothetical protein KC475_12330 [Cyanobacteria bacterium HKST-UBA03]|nr:hypothetical protein [Cyanobacteria bacterium HKST-UBA03]
MSPMPPLTKLPVSPLYASTTINSGLKMMAATIGAAVLKPVTFNWAYKRDGYFNSQERGMLITQEMVRQIVSGSLYLGTQLGCWALSKKLSPNQNALHHFANAFLGSAIIDVIARPVLMAKVSRLFPKNSFNHASPQAPISASTATQAGVSRLEAINGPTKHLQGRPRSPLNSPRLNHPTLNHPPAYRFGNQNLGTPLPYAAMTAYGPMTPGRQWYSAV